jgi:hypothetical protein
MGTSETNGSFTNLGSNPGATIRRHSILIQLSQAFQGFMMLKLVNG